MSFYELLRGNPNVKNCGRIDDHPMHAWHTPYTREFHLSDYICLGPPVVAGCDRPRT